MFYVLCLHSDRLNVLYPPFIYLSSAQPFASLTPGAASMRGTDGGRCIELYIVFICLAYLLLTAPAPASIHSARSGAPDAACATAAFAGPHLVTHFQPYPFLPTDFSFPMFLQAFVPAGLHFEAHLHTWMSRGWTDGAEWKDMDGLHGRVQFAFE